LEENSRLHTEARRYQHQIGGLETTCLHKDALLAKAKTDLEVVEVAIAKLRGEHDRLLGKLEAA
jgi:hypothetical protein